MSVARSVAEVLRDHVVWRSRQIDRMYLNVYVPHLQSVGAVVGYLRVHRGQRFASTTAVTPMTEAFVRNIDQFVNGEGVDLVAFKIGGVDVGAEAVARAVGELDRLVEVVHLDDRRHGSEGPSLTISISGVTSTSTVASVNQPRTRRSATAGTIRAQSARINA